MKNTILNIPRNSSYLSAKKNVRYLPTNIILTEIMLRLRNERIRSKQRSISIFYLFISIGIFGILRICLIIWQIYLGHIIYISYHIFNFPSKAFLRFRILLIRNEFLFRFYQLVFHYYVSHECYEYYLYIIYKNRFHAYLILANVQNCISYFGLIEKNI